MDGLAPALGWEQSTQGSRRVSLGPFEKGFKNGTYAGSSQQRLGRPGGRGISVEGGMRQ